METINEIKEYLFTNGYRIATNKLDVNKPKWLVYSKDNKIAYVGIDYWGYLELCSKHKPNSSCGTGFVIYNECSNITPEMIEEALNTICPAWYRGKLPEKYTSFDKYLQSPTNINFLKEIKTRECVVLFNNTAGQSTF